VTVATVDRTVGRNVTRVSAGANGLVFVKRLQGPRTDAERRFRNCVAWDDQQYRAGLAISPPILERDEGALRLSYGYVHDASSLQVFIDGGDVSDHDPRKLVDLLDDAAGLLAAVHSLPVTEPASPPAITRGLADLSDNPLRKFFYLTLDEYTAASGGEQACWRLFHHDEELGAAVTRWLEGLASYPDKVPIHGDVRPDQFLIGPDGMCVIDWEEFTLGPATRDLAGLAGALVFDALYRAFSRTAETATVVETHRFLVAEGRKRLDAAGPVIRGFVDAYEARSGAVVDRRRLGADIGWYLIERVLARSMVSQRLPASDKAIAGVGRQVLISDDVITDLLGSDACA
jgi:hypothetical protein